MNTEKIMKSSFSVIGKEGSTRDGEGFIQRLWDDANGHFDQVAHLAKRDAEGNLCGVWGLMTDFSRTFRPWEDGFTKGLYLAGVECRDDAAAPCGWVKWTVPAFIYLKAECTNTLLVDMLAYIQDQGLHLAGAVQDYTCPQTGRNYMLFPIEKIEEA